MFDNFWKFSGLGSKYRTYLYIFFIKQFFLTYFSWDGIAIMLETKNPKETYYIKYQQFYIVTKVQENMKKILKNTQNLKKYQTAEKMTRI